MHLPVNWTKRGAQALQKDSERATRWPGSEGSGHKAQQFCKSWECDDVMDGQVAATKPEERLTVRPFTSEHH